MAKTIRWQIPFVSLSGTQYRVDIYDEGTFTPVQLTAGPTPFVTDEDNSDDFFAPVRSQTGIIEVVTKLPNGGTLDINDMLPANNIDHPVRLVSISGSTETIEWQGFMSCEAYRTTPPFPTHSPSRLSRYWRRWRVWTWICRS